MNKTIDTCILGNGPTARLCSEFLQNTPHIVIGKQNNFGSLNTTSINSNEINLTPIFPVYNSNLYKRLWKEKYSKHNFLHYSEQGDVLIEFDKIIEQIDNAYINSYAVKRLNTNQDINTKKNIVLAYKLFGDIIFKYECNRLFEKVNRHYNSNNPHKRIGYIDNLSPYYKKITNIKINNFIWDSISKIDINKKQIITKKSVIKYQKIISTISLKRLLSKIENAPDISLISRPAYFCLIKSKNEFPTDSVFYDIEIGSPVYRVFTISPNMHIIQFTLGYQNINSNVLLQTLCKLFGKEIEIEFEHRYMINEAYPLESSSDIILKKFTLELESNNIFLLGRYAEWKYLDLHELNFTKINNNENFINK